MRSSRMRQFICFCSLLVVFARCASIITQGNLPPAGEIPKIPGPKRAVAVRALHVKENGIHFDFEGNDEVQGALMKALVESGNFSKVESWEVVPESTDLESGKGETVEKYLSLNRKSGADLFLDAYTYTVVEGSPDNPALLGVVLWMGAYLGSLGFIPMWMPRDLKVTALLSDSSGKVVRRFQLNGSASQWTWTPLYLSSRHKQATDPTLFDGQRLNMARTLVKEVSASGALSSIGVK